MQWGTAQVWIAEGGLAGRTDVHEGIVELLLSLCARGVLSSSAATCPSPVARRLLGARSTCTTRCVCRCPDPGVRIPTSKCRVFPRPR